MNVTRDVILDLLPLYLSGESSDDSRALVEGFLASDPELSRLAREDPERLLRDAVPITLKKEDEMKTIEKTKREVKVQSTLLGCAVFFSLVPFSFTFDSRGFHWLWAQSPMGSAVVAAVGIAAWAGYFATKRNLRALGL